MDLKSVLATMAVLSFPSAAIAAGGEREANVEWKIGAQSASPAATTATAQPLRVSAASGRQTVPSKEVAAVGAALKAHAEKNGGGKPSEQPKSQGGALTSGAGPGNQAAELKVVAMAMKAKASKNAGGKPSEQPKASSGAAGPAASAKPGPELKFVAASTKAKAEKNASGRPSPEPRSHGSFSGGHDHASSRMSGFERLPLLRGGPAERVRSHCNARGMCF